MKTDRTFSLTDRRRIVGLVLFCAMVMALLVIKSFNDGWFEAHTPLDLNGQPGLVFFTLGRGCECQMRVVRAAEGQLATWSVTRDGAIPIFRVDYSRRPDLARQYDVARAPALVLLDATGNVTWKQDVALSDDIPLDLYQAQSQVDVLLIKDVQ
jgi:hypothetical protein